jgi:aryl-alcohol dehydrogenase-like predicted oxidoreductase
MGGETPISLEGNTVAQPSVERTLLAPHHSISRVIKGGWQLAGGHGHVNPERALADMRLFVQTGITTFDCADIYTGVEDLIGQFLRQNRADLRSGALPHVQVHTKYVPNLDALPSLTKADVVQAIDRSLRRLGLERLDLVQFHWWDYDHPGYVDAALCLYDLQRAGKIKHIGVTNFDVPRLAQVVAAGVPVVSNQVQYSVLDHRPERGMVSYCTRRGISLLCYGTVSGGLLSERYLGATLPQPPFENRSLTKYMLIVDEFGGWDLYQGLLAVLRDVAGKHGASIATVATRYVLQKPGVAAAIVGARHTGHLPDTLRLFDFRLDEADTAAIDWIVSQSRGPEGDIYTLERAKAGKHAAIMKYNLNKT